MTTKILACKTLEDELSAAMEDLGCTFEVVWIESGLHNVPKKLHKRMQECIDAIDQAGDCDRLLVAMGRCGNSIDGVKNGNFEMIIPNVDDCISLLFGSDDERNQYAREHAAYYLTEGWMRGERNIWVEYQHTVKRYGEETAADIMEMMFGHYKQLALLDAGVYPIEKLYEETAMIEEKMNMSRTVVPVTINYLHDLLSGPWDNDRFMRIPPGCQV